MVATGTPAPQLCAYQLCSRHCIQYKLSILTQVRIFQLSNLPISQTSSHRKLSTLSFQPPQLYWREFKMRINLSGNLLLVVRIQSAWNPLRGLRLATYSANRTDNRARKLVTWFWVKQVSLFMNIRLTGTRIYQWYLSVNENCATWLVRTIQENPWLDKKPIEIISCKLGEDKKATGSVEAYQEPKFTPKFYLVVQRISPQPERKSYGEW